MSKSISVTDLQSALNAAQIRLKRAVQALAPKHKGGELEEFAAAQEALLEAERALAAAQNEPHAIPIEFPVQWDTGAPLPYLLQNDYRAFLVFFLRDADPGWDRTYVNIRHADDASPSNLAVVEFKRCICTKMGTPNDEVFHGHPLNGKGLRGYSPLRVKNSLWIKELEAINSIHSGYRPEAWRGLNHYIFGFHDCTFECVAESFLVEARATTVPELLTEICGKLVQ
ncbi:hypothetical protein [Bradyrhizobium iriomotense]|uniref:hypothetical protein n=1 Tax=Bradyrhizobium iriomotense TaxID=441950 RepID=UPI001B8A4C47|nr:hypothetical protein [Bradyrhizobium iriomotense]MBR1127845.1 hypothetical protein [Bradyrhizobium iriomotense]